MIRWIIALILGSAVLGGVYLLWHKNSTEQALAINTAPEDQLSADSKTAAPEAGHADSLSSNGPGNQVAETQPAANPAPIVASKASAEGIITVDEPWASESAPGQNSTAVFMLLTNTSQTPDRVASVSSPDAQDAVINEIKLDAGKVAKTRIATKVDLEPGIPLILEPSGLQVRLTGLKRPAKSGDTVTVVFAFEHAGILRVKVPVGELKAEGDSVEP